MCCAFLETWEIGGEHFSSLPSFCITDGSILGRSCSINRGESGRGAEFVWTHNRYLCPTSFWEELRFAEYSKHLNHPELFLKHGWFNYCGSFEFIWVLRNAEKNSQALAVKTLSPTWRGIRISSNTFSFINVCYYCYFEFRVVSIACAI